MAPYAASPQETYRSANVALWDARDPHWLVSDLGVLPRGVQILLEHPHEAATVVDLGDFEATLLSKPSRGLRILAALAEHIKDRKVGMSQWEKRNKRPLVKSGWWRPLSDVQPLPIDPESIKPQDPESIMPQAPHSKDPSNRKSHKRGRSLTAMKRMTWSRRNRKRQSMHKTPPERSQVCSIDFEHGQLNK